MPNTLTEWVAESIQRAYPGQGPGTGRAMMARLKSKESIQGFGRFTAERLNLREAAHHAFGASWDLKLQQLCHSGGAWAAESTGAVDSSVFRELLDGMSHLAIEDGFAETGSVADQLVSEEEFPAELELVEAAIPYTYVATDAVKKLAEGEPYPRTSFAGLNVYVPTLNKTGLLAYLTMEAVRANNQGFLRSCKAEIGRVLGIDRVEEILRVVLGIDQGFETDDLAVISETDILGDRLVLGIDNTYKRGSRLAQTSFNTYLTTGAWVNAIDTFVLDEPADIDAFLGLFDNMNDPRTGKLVDVSPTAFLTVRGNAVRVKSILGITEMRTTVGSVETVTGNPVDGPTEVLVDKRVKRVLTDAGVTAPVADTYLIAADFKAAFGERKLAGVPILETFETTASDADWGPPLEQDIIYAAKGRRRSKAFVREPLKSARARNTAAT